jgi:hypothetical protein
VCSIKGYVRGISNRLERGGLIKGRVCVRLGSKIPDFSDI